MKQIRAHRQAWVEAFGTPPRGLQVLHKCDNRKCINLDHLFLGTCRDNMRDMRLKASHPLQKISPTDVLVIRKRLMAGEKQRAIASDYGVHQSHISRIKLGVNWGHIC